MTRILSPLLIALGIAAVLAGSIYLYLEIFRGVDLPDPEMPTVSPPPKDRTAPPPPPPALVLPDLDESDGLVRSLVEGLSSHPKLAAWLVNEDLARRFVTSVDNVARGESPRVHLPFLKAEGGFETEDKGGRAVISEMSFRRYDLLTTVVSSLDTEGSVQLYRDLSPLFEKAYDELGYPDTFEDALGKAIDRLLAVEIPGDEIAVEQLLTSFRFEDPELEGLEPAEKHLLRMGPDNARDIQAKLLTFKTALALTQSREGSPGNGP